MDRDTRQHLRRLVGRFYDQRADSFSGTRRHPWPGWRRLLELLPPGRLRVLDAGCGNARLGTFLAASWPPGVDYVGLDAGVGLLEHARHALGTACGPPSRWRLAQADLLDEHDLERALEGLGEPAEGGRGFDLVALMGVLHHVPGEAERGALLRRLGRRLAPGGLLAATVWRADRAPGFAAKVLSWETVRDALPDPARLEAGDHLLGWAGDDGPPRYCHFADDAEVDRLVAASELDEVERFHDDGPNGASNLYVMLRHRAA
ncbi:MAG: class I SAM-dependent methyltransferase [Acidobacteriota bacterium]